MEALGPRSSKQEVDMNGTVQIYGSSSAVQPLPCRDRAYELERSQILRIRGGKGASVRVVAGALWVTQDGDARDVVLEAGDDFVLDRPGLAVLVPLGDAGARLVLGNARLAARKALSWLPMGRPAGSRACEMPAG
jgi:hypothetical protein